MNANQIERSLEHCECEFREMLIREKLSTETEVYECCLGFNKAFIQVLNENHVKPTKDQLKRFADNTAKIAVDYLLEIK